MGLFLQKTNIIRDYLEDYVDGRAFWPRSVWKKYSDSGDLGYFVLQHDPYVRKQSLMCLNELVTDALELVPDCLRYMSKLQCREIFRFCAIPQVMAIATLEKCFGNLDVFTGVVKIRKGLSCKLIVGSSTSLSHVHEAFHHFAGRIATKAKRVRTGDDPVRERTLPVCHAIRELTKARTARLQRTRTLTAIAWVLLGLALITPSSLDRNVCLVGSATLFVLVNVLQRMHGNMNPLIEARVLEMQLDHAGLAAPHVA
jgi:farnesyl-diphosphate farnesyltransferase